MLLHSILLHICLPVLYGFPIHVFLTQEAIRKVYHTLVEETDGFEWDTRYVDTNTILTHVQAHLYLYLVPVYQVPQI